MDGSPTDPSIAAKTPAVPADKDTDPADPPTEPPPDAEATRAALFEAHRPALLDAAARVVRREVQALTKATTRAAVEKFYADHGDYVRTAFRPAVTALDGSRAAVAGDFSPPPPRDAVVDHAPYVRELCDAIDAGTAAAVLARWEREKAGELVTKLLTAERPPNGQK